MCQKGEKSRKTADNHNLSGFFPFVPGDIIQTQRPAYHTVSGPLLHLQETSGTEPRRKWGGTRP